MRAPVNAGKIYFGHQPGIDVSGSSLPFTVTSPAHVAGPVDVTVQSTDGYVSSAYFGFSYGPSISKILTPSSTAEGGGTETILGYGLIPYRDRAFYPDGVQVTVGGYSMPINAYSGFQYVDGGPADPERLQTIQVTLPPGTTGASADVTISNPEGTTTTRHALAYLPATEQFPLPGAQLAQGVYDPKRDLYYFTDLTRIQVFSRTQGKWLSPIAIPQPTGSAQQALVGISLSPDASKLAVSDTLASAIYVLNPDLPASVQTFPIPNPYMNWAVQLSGLAVSDFGIVYVTSFSGGDGAPSLYKLDTNTGAISSYGFASLEAGDAYQKVLLSSDNQHVFYALPPGVNLISHITGTVYTIDTATDAVQYNPIVQVGNYELALSADQNSVFAGGALLDGNLNLHSYLGLNEVQVFDGVFIYGAKLSADGNLLFQPLENSLIVADARTGLLLDRIGLPVSLCPNYDALVSDGRDDVLVAIAGRTGDGILIIDLPSIRAPLARTRRISAKHGNAAANPVLVTGIRPRTKERTGSSAKAKIRTLDRRYRLRTPGSRSRRPVPTRHSPQPQRWHPEPLGTRGLRPD